MIALRRVLGAALLIVAGVLGACAYDPYTGAYVPCCGYYGYPYYGYPYYRYPPQYYYGPQSAPYYAPPPNQPAAYPSAPQTEPPPPQTEPTPPQTEPTPPDPGATSYPHAGGTGPARPFAS